MRWNDAAILSDAELAEIKKDIRQIRDLLRESDTAVEFRDTI